MDDADAGLDPGVGGVDVLGMPFEPLTMAEAVERIDAWVREGRSRYVCAVNVHTTMESTRDEELRRAMSGADMRVPDGQPIAWAMRLMGAAGQQRIFGPTLMMQTCVMAEERGHPVVLYGSTEETLSLLVAKLLERFPALSIADTISPPFRPLTADEDEAMVERLNASGAHLVFVGLGAPKQEMWMAAHRPAVDAVMLGVGAAFDYHSGRLKRAPVWMRRSGLEWVYRLAQEPRRLWRRYLYNNPAFMARLLGEVVRVKTRRFRRGA
jgi:N-acetylglucosaminyldiphosphoundecaprenol N-acetyl-beta-D-mannosaminyltransferase